MFAKQVSMSGLLLALVGVCVYFFLSTYEFASLIILATCLFGFMYALGGIIKNHEDESNSGLWVGILTVIIIVALLIYSDAVSVAIQGYLIS